MHVFGQNNLNKIDSLLSSLNQQGNFNGNVLIAEKGKTIYSKSFGFSNEITKAKLNEKSIFELGSVSKQFTAMAIAILHKNGKLSYDDKMAKYIPALSMYNNITIRHLLNHTGGLPDYMEIMDTIFDKSKIATNKDIIAIFAKYKPAVLFEPATQWQYSNTGYALLASIIEKVSGMTYGEYLHKVIFKPLKMANTFVYNRRYAPKKIDNYAYGYVYSDSLKKYCLPDELSSTNFVIWLDGIVGDGTVNSTVVDLLKWDRALYNNKLLPAKNKNEIFTAAQLNNKSYTGYGFGWFIENNGVYGNIVNHTGGWPGYMTIVDRHIQNNKTIIILMNYTNEKTYLPIADVRRLLYNIEPLKHITLTPQEIEKFAGNYINSAGNVINLMVEDSILYRSMGDMEQLELKPISKTKFHLMGYNPDVFYEFILENNTVKKYIMTQPETGVVKELIRQ